MSEDERAELEELRQLVENLRQRLQLVESYVRYAQTK